MKQRDGTILFENRPRIVSSASVVGKKEGEGPLREDFDCIIHDSYVGQETFEKGESELMRTALGIAMDKARLTPRDIGTAFCGDLLNQCVASSFAVNGSPIPYVGIYGACSTMALGLILSAIMVESGASQRAICAASSHYCTAERQYRFPLEYGSQRPPTAQWTVTGAGACILEADWTCTKGDSGGEAPAGGASPDSAVTSHGNDSSSVEAQNRENASVSGAVSQADMPYIHAARIGIITDMGVTDQNNMGAAMAPAVVK